MCKQNTTLKLPSQSADQCSGRIKRAATSLDIPVQVVTTPGRKLRDFITSSRPLDRPHCPNNNWGPPTTARTEQL